MMERPQRDLDDVAPRAISYRSKHLPKKWGEGAHETQEVPEMSKIHNVYGSNKQMLFRGDCFTCQADYRSHRDLQGLSFNELLSKLEWAFG